MGKYILDYIQFRVFHNIFLTLQILFILIPGISNLRYPIYYPVAKGTQARYRYSQKGRGFEVVERSGLKRSFTRFTSRCHIC